MWEHSLVILHSDLMDRFHGERTTPDGVADDTTRESWLVFIHELKSMPWQIDVDGKDLREHVPESLVPTSPDAVATFKIQLNADVRINVFPLAVDSIDFDFDTAEMRSQAEVDLLVEFIEFLGRSIGRDVVISHEGDSTREFLKFDRNADEVRFTDDEESFTF